MLISSKADGRMQSDATTDQEQAALADLAEAEERYPWMDMTEVHARLEREREAKREAAVDQQAVAQAVHQPVVRNAAAGAAFGASILGRKPDDIASAKLVKAECKKVRDGDLGLPTDILTAQAMSLDAVFTEMLRRAASNLGEYPDAVERYMRLAFKAQAQCRTTVEALGKLARGGEQVVKHVHIDNRGGQAVVTDTVTTGGANAREAEQPHALAHAHVAALPGADPFRSGMPIGGDEERALSDARGDVAGSAEGQPECLEARRQIG
jgi:hypothetical protein